MEAQAKLNNSNKNIKKRLIIEDDDDETQFIKQNTRKDVLNNMILNKKLPGKTLFGLIMKENNPCQDSRDESREGWLYEILWLIVIMLKCVENINYKEILGGQLDNLKKITNINELLKCKISGGGNNISDMTILDIDGQTLIPFSIK